MPELNQTGRVTRFGTVEVDLQTGELRKSDFRIKLKDQPFQILAPVVGTSRTSRDSGRTATKVVAG